ncbi:MAG: ABC transporter permease [Cyclobacteriaceae bacterium]
MLFKTYVIVALRQLLKKPIFYLLNIGGLGVGMAAFISISLYVGYHLRFDSFHERVGDTYRIVHTFKLNDAPYTTVATYAKVGPALTEEYPQVQEYCRLVQVYGGGVQLTKGEERIMIEDAYYTDPSFFNMFSFPMIAGTQSAFQAVNSVMISDRLAEVLFADQSPLGETIEMGSTDGTNRYQVAGVFENTQPSHIKADLLISMTTLEQAWNAPLNSNWRWFDFVTYVQLQQGTDAASFEAGLPAFVDRHGGEKLGSQRIDLGLQPLVDIHLNSHYNQEISANEDLNAMMFLAVIGVMVLFIAWINFINLYTALVSERTKEVGVRKSLGSSKTQLISQYLTEAGLINLLAMAVALLLVYFVVQQGPAVGLYFELPQWGLLSIGIPLGFLVLSTLISGLYPAILLSNAGVKKTDQTSKYRNWLVIGQFAVSAALITGTFVVINQFHYMQNADTGINTSSVIAVPLTDFQNDAAGHVRNLSRVKDQLTNLNGVISAAYSSDIPGKEVGWRGGSHVMGDRSGAESSHLVYKMTLDDQLLSLLNIDIIEGRGFSGPQDSLSVMINERAVAEYNFTSNQDAINQHIRFNGMDTFRVVGVVEDYFQEALSEPIKPTAYFMVPNEIRYLLVKFNDQNENELLSTIEALVNTHFPKNNFDPLWLDENMDDRHASTAQFLYLFNAFSGLAILISILGLVGLANYNAQKHQKEMSIRKVLGASTASLNARFLTAFIKLTVLGNLIALPVIYYVGNDWLDQFANRVGFNWTYPVYTVLLCALITVASTLYSTYRAANANPVKILRAE